MLEIDTKGLQDTLHVTKSTYTNLARRFEQRKKFTDFILLYYSASLLILLITSKLFPVFDVEISRYLSIVMLVVVVVYATINRYANYDSRMQSIYQMVNRLEIILQGVNATNQELKRMEFVNLMKNARSTERVDSFRTMKTRCAERGISWFLMWVDSEGTKADWLDKKKTASNKIHRTTAEEVAQEQDLEEINQLCSDLLEVSPMMQQIKIMGEGIWKAFLAVLPIVVAVACMRKAITIPDIFSRR